MLQTGNIIFVSTIYMAVLFGLAYYGDKRCDQGRSMVGNPYIYTLSLAIYCTAWTFYGSVGHAVRTGPEFLTVYIGPTLMFALAYPVILKIIRISKTYRITSIADFIASRYGKSSALGGIVTIIALIGVAPYISLQLKAISTSFLLISHYPDITLLHFSKAPIFQDTTFYVALILAAFAILFGTRSLETTERHEGLVVAIAFESIVKLVAFLSVGVFVTHMIYQTPGGFSQGFSSLYEVSRLFTIERHTAGQSAGVYSGWAISIFLSMMAVLFLPRQFQAAVVENVDEKHLKKAIWLFPLYLFVINLFVLPVAFGGVIAFPGGEVDADTFVLTLPMLKNKEGLALFVFIGGLSASTSMVIVETVALSTMLSNEIVMPALIRGWSSRFTQGKDLTAPLLLIRRAIILVILLLAYGYFRIIGEFYALVSIGLVSFAAVAQFAPAILGGIFWKRASKSGAICGLMAGFALWTYTLFLPSLAQAGLISQDFITSGPFGIEILKPFQLFGLQDLNRIEHSVFWTMLANVGVYIGVSLFSKPSAMEHAQATLFTDIFKNSRETSESTFWRGTASIRDIESLLRRFLGKRRAEEAMAEYTGKGRITRGQALTTDAGLVIYAEKLLAGAIGSASARIVVSSVVKEEPLGLGEVMDILDETRHAIAHSQELERVSNDLKAANERLKELDRLKDDFISTVTHELRTPLTSIRSVAEILYDNPDLDSEKHENFISIIINESKRLSRLIVQVLDFQKIESGVMLWEKSRLDMKEIVKEAVCATSSLVESKNVRMSARLPDAPAPAFGDRDKLIQAMINFISNAVKFCPAEEGRIDIHLKAAGNEWNVFVKDNGIGIDASNHEKVFRKFHQVKDSSLGRPTGSGLGLAITKRIIESHGGEVRVESEPGRGSVFSFSIPADSVGASH
ncbi:Histidine kinase [Candidatus Desulfarcum epimagneticum]|uniref:histidine kinase n=1 Tax=uncultured Desulfobacteraceae bacterium TaxID=218296 RepID=A0A484HJ36_9BACT|nr:Histidine kinase [uncultured Desulfobacteraceae bacterium]